MPPGRSPSRRGGRRTGQPGAQYTNRTDLQQAPRAVPGQTYGQAGAQLQAQAQIPLAGGGPNAGPVAPQMGTPPSEGGGLLGPGATPGSLGPLHAPTGRPGEPVTHGLATGPGAGPEALTPPDPLIGAAAIMNNLGSSADAEVQALRMKVNAMLGNQGAA